MAQEYIRVIINHLDTIITVLVTIAGFAITILTTKLSLKNEIAKEKVSNSTHELSPVRLKNKLRHSYNVVIL